MVLSDKKIEFLPRARVLLVEDSSTDQFFIKKALEASSWVKEVHIVGTAEEAIDFLEKKGKHVAALRPDLIICDLNLPGKGGQFVLQTVKSTNKWMAIPMVMFSTCAEEKNVANAYATGAEIYLRKPFEPEALLRMMENLSDFWHSVKRKSKGKRRRKIRAMLLRSRFISSGNRLNTLIHRLFHVTP